MSNKKTRNHYGNIPRTEEVIFKETRLPFQGNFAFLVSFFVLILRRPRFLPLQQNDYENFAPFSGFSSLRKWALYGQNIFLRVNLLDSVLTACHVIRFDSLKLKYFYI